MCFLVAESVCTPHPKKRYLRESFATQQLNGLLFFLVEYCGVRLNRTRYQPAAFRTTSPRTNLTNQVCQDASGLALQVAAVPAPVFASCTRRTETGAEPEDTHGSQPGAAYSMEVGLSVVDPQVPEVISSPI